MADDKPDPSAMIQALDAAKNIVAALQELPMPLQKKALQFAADVLGHVVGGDAGPLVTVIGSPPAPPLAEGVLRYAPRKREFESIADLFHATDPKSDADRALVTGYWLQSRSTEPDFDAQSVNTALKDFGHKVSNITQAFNALIARRPQFVIQTKKSG